MWYHIDIKHLPMLRFAGRDTLSPPRLHIRRRPMDYILYFIQEGTMYLRENGEDYVLRAGDVILLDTDFIHEGFRSAQCAYFYVHFQHDQITHIYEQSPEELLELRQKSLSSATNTYDLCSGSQIILPKHYHFSDISVFSALTQRVEEIKQRQITALEHYKQLGAALLVEIMIQIERSYISSQLLQRTDIPARTYEKVQSILLYLNQNYQEKLTGTHLAREFSMDFDHLNRIFKRVMQVTIFQYLTSLRIEHAKIYLSTTAYSVEEIGTLVGYPDIYYFCRIFKKQTGQTPRAYALRQMI